MEHVDEQRAVERVVGERQRLSVVLGDGDGRTGLDVHVDAADDHVGHARGQARDQAAIGAADVEDTLIAT
jgi:hypothetical protein